MKTLLGIIVLLVADYFGGMALSRNMAALISPIMILLFAAEMAVWALWVRARMRKTKPGPQDSA